MNMTPADAMLYLVIAASIAILVYVKFGKRDSRGQVRQRSMRSGVFDLFPKDENRETEVNRDFRFFVQYPIHVEPLDKGRL